MQLTRLLSISPTLALALAFLLSVAHLACTATSETIRGSRETCDVEGDDITVDKILNTSCFRCICKNGFVECLKHQCPNTDGCYALLEPRDDECCYKCTGCVQNGVHHASDTEWTEEKDPCHVYTCKGGVITKSKLECYTPCSKPKPAPPGQCCPVCDGCLMNGQKVTADRSVTTTEDPCVTCKCNNNKQLTCAKLACPILNCPNAKIVRDPGKCCPHCIGSAKFYAPPKGACMFGMYVLNSGTKYCTDSCTCCTCVNSTLSCVRDTCPVLECPSELQTTAPGRCCKQCPAVQESRASCSVGGRTYQDDENWQLDSCKTCICKQGKVRCAMLVCPPVSPCPPGSKLEHPEGQCCARCVESDGICKVFGDPHYRTFDGKFYTFKGACKYQLVTDCVGHTFSIRVTNDAKKTKYSAWTKTIALKVGDLKVNLGQKMRVKVNGKRVTIPYRIEHKRLNINFTDDSVIVSTDIGIKVLWDGISVLEVSVPSSYRGRLCGLCGNFNSLPRDDFTSRHGKLLQDMQKFGHSWAVISKKTCENVRHSKVENIDKEKRCRGRKDHRLCTRLRSQIFDPCHRKVNPTMYYKACLQDMCECPTEHCYCQSFTAYVHECKRLGIQLPHWRKSTKCRTIWDQLGYPANSSTYRGVN